MKIIFIVHIALKTGKKNYYQSSPKYFIDEIVYIYVKLFCQFKKQCYFIIIIIIICVCVCVIGAPRAELQMRKVVNLGSELNVKIKRVNIGQKCNQL